MSGDMWASLDSFAVDPARLRAQRVITAARDEPAFAAFDVLRARLTQALRDNGWKRVAITSPTADCGKTFTAVNLAITLSRYDATRTVLMDMDMRNSSLHRVLGVKRPGSLGDYLRGLVTTEQAFRVPGRNTLNIGQNLAIGFNGKREEFAAELLQDPLTEEVLEVMDEDLEPDVVLMDTPPVLTADDVIAMRPLYDAVLIVAGGGQTKAEEIKLISRHLGKEKPILGVVLNRAEGATVSSGGYY